MNLIPAGTTPIKPSQFQFRLARDLPVFAPTHAARIFSQTFLETEVDSPSY
jgi:hypothetical protein